uniref:B box-type domain-containing protein n=1 Tax=Heliothis virescens TaxID=7102 RepID=A0A2A4JP59_HELVI
MENVNFQPSGDEIERALMDLGPLLGVTIKEEAPDELGDAAAPATAALNVRTAYSTPQHHVSSTPETGGADDKGSADSLASPAARASLAATRCVLCHTALALADGTPKLMECLHSACEPCIRAKLDEKQASSRDFLGAERLAVTCPACRLQCQVANMIDQRFVLEKMQLEQAGSNGVSGDQQCNSCEDTEPATSYCVDCAEFICDNCTCDRLTCRDCQLQHHRDHKYQFSTEMAAQARSTISSLLSEVSYKRVLLGSAMKVIRDRQHLIADKKKALVHEITQTVVKLTNAINTRGKQLVLRLNEVCDGKQRTLTEKKEALEQLAAITDHCVAFVTAALQGSDTAVLHAKRQVCAHLQRIKSRRADIPNPEIPVRIALQLDKLPELVRVLAQLGSIVVDGKPDGPAQGPYHPPAGAAGVALQHVAMHQITLGRARAPPVTSTNPKTPSPSLNGGVPGELDKVCAASVQDLMATIAKLDSNGVQVVAEAEAGGPAAPSPAPAVHSSTDEPRADPNEDWCAVCMDGGELVCCDRCPKVFHQYCHIPTVDKLPDEADAWQCLLCESLAELPADEPAPPGGGLPPRQQRLAERLTLELYCQYEPSLPFREPVPPDNLHYHSKVSRPMCLDAMRMKLQPRSPQRYTHVSQFVADARLLFRNAYAYNPPDSATYKDAKRLEEFFDAQLAKWLPEYVCWPGDGEPPAKRRHLAL